MNLTDLRVTVTPPRGETIILNHSDAAAATNGEASIIAAIEVQDRITPPWFHCSESSAALTILTSDPDPVQLDTTITIEAQIQSGTWRTIFIGWVETDKTIRVAKAADGPTLWAHELSCQSVLGLASETKTAIRPIETTTARLTALAAAHPGLIQQPTYPYADITWTADPDSDPHLAALAADTDVLTAWTQAAAAQDRRTVIIGGKLAISPMSGFLRNHSWWHPSFPHAVVQRPVDPTDLTAAAATLSRASHISTVEIKFSAGGESVTETVTDTIVRGGSVTLDVGISDALADVPGQIVYPPSTIALNRSRALAQALISAPVEPTLGETRLQDAGDDNDLLADAPTGRSSGQWPHFLLEITPTPSNLGRWHIITGSTLTIDRWLSMRIAWQTIPAGLAGLQPIRFDHFAASADRFADDARDNMSPTLFPHLAINRPPGA